MKCISKAFGVRAGISRPLGTSLNKKSKKGAMEILEVLIAVLMIVAIFALVVMMNTRFSSVIDTYMPFRMAVLVANRLSGSSDLAFTPPAGESAHKNLLSAAKLDNYVKNYNETMPPGSALLCFHWRASVKEPDTNGVWEFGYNTLADIPAQLLSSITSAPEEAYKSILENPINVFKFAYPATFMAENVLKDLIDMAPASYSLPVSVATDSGAVSCASAGGTCKAWLGYYCASDETDLDDPTTTKDCTPGVFGATRHCCIKSAFAYVNKTGATMPAMLEVSVWKAKPECRDKAVIQKMLDEIKASAGG